VEIEKFDKSGEYTQRNETILLAIIAAWSLHYEAGFRIDPNEPEWPVAFIELPTGQVSWHLPQHVKPWDLHTTAEKYERIRAYREHANRPEVTT
jgi:hypothetical protein